LIVEPFYFFKVCVQPQERFWKRLFFVPST